MGKLSGFKKMIGSMGKKIFNWRQPKYPINILAVMLEAVVDEYARINNGDYRAALIELESFLSPAGQELVSSLLLEPAVGNIAFKSFMTDDLDDLVWLTKTSLYAIFGKQGYNTFFGKHGVHLLTASQSEEEVPTLIISFQKCPFCCNVNITAEQLMDQNYGKILEALFGEMIRTVQDSVGNDYVVICRETKCFLRGDDAGEYRIWLYTKDEYEEKVFLNKFLSPATA